MCLVQNMLESRRLKEWKHTSDPLTLIARFARLSGHLDGSRVCHRFAGLGWGQEAVVYTWESERTHMVFLQSLTLLFLALIVLLVSLLSTPILLLKMFLSFMGASTGRHGWRR